MTLLRLRHHEPRAAILMYHVVDDVPFDPWGLAVGPARFEQHLAILSDLAVPTTLSDLADGLRGGNLVDGAVVVIFDDGYRNNLEHALPALRRHAISATVFALSGMIGETRSCWWDELAQIVLTPRELPSRWWPRDLGPCNVGMPALEVGAARYSDGEQHRRDCLWRQHEGRAPSARVSLYLRLWEHLVAFDPSARRLLLDDLAHWAGVEVEAMACHRMLGPDDLATLASDPLIEIGAHTVSHPMLGRLPDEHAARELRSGRDQLEAMLGTRVDLLAYPFGSHREGTVRAARDAGFVAACTTQAAPVTRSADLWRLPRFDVKDWDAKVFRRNITRWLEGP